MSVGFSGQNRFRVAVERDEYVFQGTEGESVGDEKSDEMVNGSSKEQKIPDKLITKRNQKYRFTLARVSI